MYACKTDWFYVVEVKLGEKENIITKRLRMFTDEKEAKELLDICKELKPKSRFYVEKETDIDYV